MKVISVLKRSLRMRSAVRLLVFTLFLIALSCQQDEIDQNLLRTDDLPFIPTSELAGTASVNYFAEETFTITTKDALVETRDLNNPDYEYLENFFISIQNGNSGKTKVAKLEILIEGVPVITYADFKTNLNIVQKEITLQEGSVLEVRLDGSRGRFVKIKIDGYLKNTTISDIDGNYYHTVQICDQWWMAENLKTTKLNDGTPLTVIFAEADWWGHTIPTYCWYNHDVTNKDVYGALYDWYAVTSGNLCPTGWHAPGDEEFQELADCLGGNQVAGGKLKETGTVHWQSPNTGATNESGFTALPGGMRDMGGLFKALGTSALFRSTAVTGDGAQGNGWSLNYFGTDFHLLDYERTISMSVRCVKD